MANEFVQTMSDARVDAQSLSDFVFKPAGFKVTRRLAPPIDTLQFYIDSFDATKATTDAYIATIPNIVNDAINNTAVEGGVLADTFVTVTANGSGSIARTQRDKNSDVVSVKDFGAIGDGVADDTTAIINALESEKPLLVPEGDYLITQTLTVQDFRYIRGVGAQNSRFIFKDCDGFVFSRQQDTLQFLDLRDFAIVRRGLGTAYTGLRIDFTLPTWFNFDKIHYNYAHLDSLSFYNEQGVKHGAWNIGIDTLNMSSSKFSNIQILGADGSADPAQAGQPRTSYFSDWGIRCTANNNKSVENFFSYLSINFTKTAIEVEGNEGVFVNNSNLVDVVKGIYVHSPSEKPHVDIHSCHVNAHTTGIKIYNMAQCFIHSNLMYRTSLSKENVLSTSIMLIDTALGIISKNVLAAGLLANFTGNHYGISVAGNQTRTLIDGNVIKEAHVAIHVSDDVTGGLFVGQQVYNYVPIKIKMVAENFAPLAFPIEYNYTALEEIEPEAIKNITFTDRKSVHSGLSLPSYTPSANIAIPEDGLYTVEVAVSAATRRNTSVEIRINDVSTAKRLLTQVTPSNPLVSTSFISKKMRLAKGQNLKLDLYSGRGFDYALTPNNDIVRIPNDIMSAVYSASVTITCEALF